MISRITKIYNVIPSTFTFTSTEKRERHSVSSYVGPPPPNIVFARMNVLCARLDRGRMMGKGCTPEEQKGGKKPTGTMSGVRVGC